MVPSLKARLGLEFYDQNAGSDPSDAHDLPVVCERTADAVAQLDALGLLEEVTGDESTDVIQIFLRENADGLAHTTNGNSQSDYDSSDGELYMI